jgi:topoisomerase-4 subunit A
LVSNTIKKNRNKGKRNFYFVAKKVWYDDTVQRLNVDGRGELLGEFRPSDKILIQQSGKLK